MTETFNIVKRAYSEYTIWGTVRGTYLEALEVADAAERMYKDGEYLVRRPNEPNWIPVSSYQSGLDYL